MPGNYSVTEPHPSVAKSSVYIGGGRGGAGNYKKYSSEELSKGPDATGPPARISLTRPFKRMVVGGRGGAGNVYSPDEMTQEPMFFFDEEMEKRHSAPVYHIGRGGAANFVNPSTMQRTTRAGSSDSAMSINTQSSTNSMRNAVGIMTRKLSNK
ncbi:Hypothetical protein R9X50_00468300 [Acrodontium crateriforme]|uniref:Uncharacterized protein n=1 Tax=Acrodontium crateriforme TaxID=150365 RepID=A0AAQ3R8K1_9PEZI|nr:Hypothetical protein R9X50_00468300 [Acrodontium crateriforme]